MKFNNKEKRILSITLAAWGIFLVGSGLVMNVNTKTITNTTYSLNIQKKKIRETQAKTNEIKLKDIEIEINNPISVDVKDYLENIETLSVNTLKSLKLDTSLVNINQAGTYQYTITYNKKKYVGNIIVKEKELPNVTFTLKLITLKVSQSLSNIKKDYINEVLDDEVYENMELVLPTIDNTKPGKYTYTISYNGTVYQGIIEITEDQKPEITIIPSTKPSPPQSPEPAPEQTEQETTPET